MFAFNFELDKFKNGSAVARNELGVSYNRNQPVVTCWILYFKLDLLIITAAFDIKKPSNKNIKMKSVLIAAFLAIIFAVTAEQVCSTDPSRCDFNIPSIHAGAEQIMCAPGRNIGNVFT